jgi:hypothetical protein
VIVLDENFDENQRSLLRSWRIPSRQIGDEVGRLGMKDDEVIPMLQQLTRPTFFTRDRGLFESHLAHRRYCLVVLEVRVREAAIFAKRVLRHPEFNTQAKRMGKVIRASHNGITVVMVGQAGERYYAWTKRG